MEEYSLDSLTVQEAIVDFLVVQVPLEDMEHQEPTVELEDVEPTVVKELLELTVELDQ